MLVSYRYEYNCAQRPAMVNWYRGNRNNIDDVWLARLVAQSDHTTNQQH